MGSCSQNELAQVHKTACLCSSQIELPRRLPSDARVGAGHHGHFPLGRYPLRELSAAEAVAHSRSRFGRPPLPRGYIIEMRTHASLPDRCLFNRIVRNNRK